MFFWEVLNDRVQEVSLECSYEFPEATLCMIEGEREREERERERERHPPGPLVGQRFRGKILVPKAVIAGWFCRVDLVLRDEFLLAVVHEAIPYITGKQATRRCHATPA